MSNASSMHQIAGNYQAKQAEILSFIVSALPKNTSPVFKKFVEQFYAKMPVADLAQYDPKEAIVLANSAFEFMDIRPSHEPKIRIFMPQKAVHGYDGKYMVVELLNDDMPFLVDSLSAELTRQGFTIRETLHPILRVKRDKKGKLEAIGDSTAKEEGSQLESFIHFELSGLSEDQETIDQLITDLEWVLKHTRAAVEDWRSILAKVEEQIQRLENVSKYFDREAVNEVQDFLRWLMDKNFVFTGYAEYNFFDSNGREKLSVLSGSALGILKINDDIVLRGLEALPPEIRHFLLVPQIVEITKSNRRSLVHRNVPMDYIGIKRLDAKGNVIGEVRFLGLFTSNVYYQSADEIPLVRQKIGRVLERANFTPQSHDGKALKAILEFMPRDEIFQMSEEVLFETSMGILSLEAKPRVRVFARRDAFERFVSLMVFVPRERFSTELRRQIQSLVEKAFNGTISSFSTQIAEASLARLHLIVRTTPGDIPPVDILKIEEEIARRAYLWSDLLYQALVENHGERQAEKLQRIYATAFSNAYIDRYDAHAAVYDIGKIEEAISRKELSLELYRRHKKQDEKQIHLKIYNPNDQIALSDFLPMLENAGFRVIEEQPFQIDLQVISQSVWIHDFKLELTGDQPVALERVKALMEEALLKIWHREMENDRFNALVVKAELPWRKVVCLRAYAKYLKQIGFTYSQAAIEHALSQQPHIVKNIIALFEARFDLDKKDKDKRQQALLATIEEQLAKVTDAVTDRILRCYTDTIMATLRTNYYQTAQDGTYKPVLSFKFDSRHVPDLPLPKPFAEIFVYGTRVEGIHLRGGKVARGGLRWSDRHEDFRTEILGLMKAQMVKNSVIVPVGSKGGFVVKQPPQAGGREAYMEEGVSCYKMYLSGLLDVTDNIVNGKVTPPAQVVRHDDDDPYLVVAADKGTATFSDIANSVSAAYGFWLGDAFASGGSAGYDHKKMGITARGGWVSVTRHFSEMGIDISKKDFSVVGVGDMSGDVFGNGMLLSEHIRLVAAFNHMHIFIDPAPDTVTSFKERKRLFNLPRSTWKDYNPDLISKGGGIFERSAKSITLSKEAREILGIEKTTLTPDELVKAILLSPVDLLWNGGIGTYVKAEEESNEQVGDRSNNAVRVNGRDLRCKIVGEGGNLGFTQKGRIEYARNGGRINTDAIDNSAGVDCSDHEVNIKIAFSSLLSKGKLTLPQRDSHLESMTDEVARLVLKDNILQTQALTIAEQQGVRLLEAQSRLMHMLEQQGLLDRAIEYLPNDKQLTELKAARKGLTRPELAVLLSYSKMVIYREILESSLPDEPYFIADLKRYFPLKMQKEFEEAITSHQLKREIIATVVTNSIVNRAGITFFSTIAEDLGAAARDIAAAYTLARDAFELRDLWKEIEESGDNIHVSVKADMYAAASDFLERVTTWLLRNLPLPLDIEKISTEIVPGIVEIRKNKAKLYSDITREAADKRFDALVGQDVPEKLATRIASLELMSSAFDIISVGRQTKLPLTAVGKLYFELDDRLNLGWLRLCAHNIAAMSHWERLAIQAIIGDLYDEQRRLTAHVITEMCRDGLCTDSVDAWVAANETDIRRFERFMDDMKSGDTPDISRLMVALRHIRSL